MKKIIYLQQMQIFNKLVVVLLLFIENDKVKMEYGIIGTGIFILLMGGIGRISESLILPCYLPFLYITIRVTKLFSLLYYSWEIAILINMVCILIASYKFYRMVKGEGIDKINTIPLDAPIHIYNNAALSSIT